MKEDSKKIAIKTRDVYLKQHKNFYKSKAMFDRFTKMVADPKYFNLKKSDFKGKRVLDAGCGNSGYLEVGLSKFGVEHITCLDLGRAWIPELRDVITGSKLDLDMFDFVSGSTDKLPFPDDHFDIVFSNGVLMHLTDKKQIERAWKELARVTKPGGYLYILLGCPGGLFEQEVIPAVRRYYTNNKKFKKFVDTLDAEVTEDILKFIATEMKRQTGETFNYKKAAKLFDTDFTTWVQNVIQVPKRFIIDLDEKYAHDMYKKFGFEKPKQCKRFVKRSNIRKFLAPLHYRSENEFAKLLYGPGNLEYIARKKK